MIVRTLDEAMAPITDGCVLAVPRDVSGVAMAATRALIRRGVRRLHLVALPTSSLQADLLIGAGCVETTRDLGRQPRRIRAGAALRRRGDVGRDRASRTPPARRCTPASRRRKRACPFMPLRGLIGSDVLAHRPDWKVVDNPFGNDDPIVLLPAIKPDVALFHAPLADRDGNVWIGRDRELAMMAHAAAKTVVTVEKLHDGNLFDDPFSRPARSAASTSRRSRSRRRAPGRSRSPITTRRTPRTSPNMRAWPRPPKALRPISTGTCMTSAPLNGFRNEELLADAIAGLIGDARHAAIGAASPIPAAAAMLARERGNGRPYVSLLGSRRQSFFTDGGRELFDCAGQGRIDVFFLSGGQIDGAGNINLVSIGDYEHPKVRFPGSFGSAYMYYVVPKVILFRLEHTRRTLVEKVDFISAPGTSPDNVFRPGGPIALITNRCLFAFDRARKRFRLASVHPGHTAAEVAEHTGFDFDRPPHVPVTAAPSPETLRLLRTVVAPQLAEVYPQFAAEVFGIADLAHRQRAIAAGGARAWSLCAATAGRGAASNGLKGYDA